ncbi:hypothetical protein G6F56_002500 [Rhizopus delemar]|nr:hypothetical protein G6F56_002500 [Rhizopus delemar]
MADPFFKRSSNDDSSDDDDWRDPHINQAPTGLSRASSVFDDASTLVSDRSNVASSAISETTAKNATPSGSPDDYWVLPPHCTPLQILGPKRFRTGEIARATGVYLTYNEDLHQISLWGDQIAIDKAKRQLNLIAVRLSEEDPTPTRTTKKWSRPERELTEKEKRREEKRQQRILEDKKYLGEPTEKQAYYSVYYVPEGNVSITNLVGLNDCYLNEIRVDCKTYIEFDPPSRTFRMSSGEQENVKMAASRLRNWHLRIGRNPEPSLARLMQQPSGKVMLKYRKLPSDFVIYQYVSPDTEEVLREKQRIFDIISTGRMNHLNLIQFPDDDRVREDELSEIEKTLDERNEKIVRDLLSTGLESLRLKDWDIRMKIRYGTICLVDFPKKDNENLTIEEVSENMFKKSRFKSALAPCISKTRTNLESLFDYLANNGQEFSDNPRTSFDITADQYPVSIPAEDRRKKEMRMRGDMWRTRMKVAFTDRGERGLWSTVTHCNDLVDISSFNCEGPYSWDLKLQYARSFPHDDITAPHEKFSYNLRLSSSGRLIMVPVIDYHPETVTQKTEWRYFWNGFIVEIVQEELWDLIRIKRDDKELPLDFSDIEPHRVLFKVSMYKEAWIDRLSQNLRLKVGEAPNWTIRDFLGTQEENVRNIMHFAKKFGNILASEVPLYYGQASNSLV